MHYGVIQCEKFTFLQFNSISIGIEAPSVPGISVFCRNYILDAQPDQIHNVDNQKCGRIFIRLWPLALFLPIYPEVVLLIGNVKMLPLQL